MKNQEAKKKKEETLNQLNNINNKIKVRVYKRNHSMNYGSGGFGYSKGKAIIIGNNDNLSNNLLIHACMSRHGDYAYGDLESMECRDQDGGHSYYELLETVYIDSEKAPDRIKSAIEENEDHDIYDVNCGEKNKSKMKIIFNELEDLLFIEDDDEINKFMSNIPVNGQIRCDELVELLENMVANSGGLTVSDILISFMNNVMLQGERDEILERIQKE